MRADPAGLPGSAAAAHTAAAQAVPVAVVGLACRYPDADDPAALLDLIVTGRRAFRRVPPGLLRPADPGHLAGEGSQPAGRPARPRAALIENWRFDPAIIGLTALGPAALGLTSPGPAALGPAAPGLAALEPAALGPAAPGTAGADPALLLAAETCGRALAASGLAPVAVSPTLTGHQPARAAAFFAAAQNPGQIAAAIARQLGYGAPGAAHSCSLAATAAACGELAAGRVDLAIAGGVDFGLRAADLAAWARAGLLATSDMRVYDQNPTGFLPGEGCGVVVLMRTADAVAAGLPVYAQLRGWASGARQADQLDIMRQAYLAARTDPDDVQLIEGCGTGIALADAAELAALTELRAGARQAAALSAVSANVGSARAAAGIASLIKVVLTIGNAVLPPSTGIRTPHEALAAAHAALRPLTAPQIWQASTRHAGCSAQDANGGTFTHLVVRADARRPAGPRNPRPRRGSGTDPGGSAQARPAAIAAHRPAPAPGYPPGFRYPFAYLLHAQDLAAMTAILTRIADVAPWLSDAEMQDLAAQLSRTAGRCAGAGSQRGIRIGIVASSQDQLAALAAEARTLLPGPGGAGLTARAGIFALADTDPEASAGAEVTLLLAGQPDEDGMPQRELSRILSVLARLDELGVRASAAVGHGTGELAGLVWAGCIGPADARALLELRSEPAATQAGPAAGSGAADGAAARLPAADPAGEIRRQISSLEFRSPRQRLLSGYLGTELSGHGSITEMLCGRLLDQPPVDHTLAQGRLNAAVRSASLDAAVLLGTGLDRQLASALGHLDRVLTVSAVDPAADRHLARAAAALFAAGALTRPAALYSRRPSRPFDLWHDQVFGGRPSGGSAPYRSQASPPGQPDQHSSAPPRARHARAGQLPGTARQSSHRAGQPHRGGLAWSAGLGPWVRCYAEQPGRAVTQATVADDRPWNVLTGGCEPLRMKVLELFRHDQEADRTLAVLGSLDDPGTREAALLAATDLIRTGELVVIAAGPALRGWWATLHAEHPSVGITFVRAPLDSSGLMAARQVAAVSPGSYREVAIGADGIAREPVMTPMPAPGGAPCPIGPDDVALISRDSGAAGLALAQVVACSGAVAVIAGPESPADGRAQIAAELDRLRKAGARIGYADVDLADSGALVKAVRLVEREYGRITVLGHGIGLSPHRALVELTHRDVHEELRRQVAALDQLVAAVRSAARHGLRRSDRLRLIITSGSIVGQYGLAQEGLLALATGTLAEHASRLAADVGDCRAIHLDWPVWAGTEAGQSADLALCCDRAGFATLPVDDGARMLLKTLTTADLPARLAVHGRAGLVPPAPVARHVADRPGRFVERVLLHYPQVELIAQARLTLRSDPYLCDYLADGAAVLPPVLAIEAMAQAAALLAGRPLLAVSDLTMTAPVLLPAESRDAVTVIRIYALRDADARTVTVALRCDTSEFTVEHCRATFAQAPDVPKPGGAAEPAGSGSPGSGGRAADPRERAAACVDGSELYGPVCFQVGRFRRLTLVHLESSRAASALAHGPDRLPWFGGAVAAAGLAGHQAERELLLGSAGLNDATVQLIQACVPHRRLMPAGCESALFASRAPVGTITVRAAEVSGGIAAAGESCWDVEATDAAGHTLVAWRRLRMRDVGPLPRGGPWPVQMVGSYLERVAIELGLDPGLRVHVGRASAAYPEHLGAAPGSRRRRDLRLRVEAPGQAAGGWHPADFASTRTVQASCQPAAGQPGTAGISAGRTADQDAGRAGEGGTATGRDWLAVLAAAGLSRPGTQPAAAMAAALAACLRRDVPPPDLTITGHQIAGAGWLLLRSGDASIVCTVVDLTAIGPVAFAVMTGVPAGAGTGTPAGGAAGPLPRPRAASEPADRSVANQITSP